MEDRRLRQAGDNVWYYNEEAQSLKQGQIRQIHRTYLESIDKEDEITETKYYLQVGEYHYTGVLEYSLFDTKAQFIERVIT